MGGTLAYLTLTSQSVKYLSVEETDTIYLTEAVGEFESMTPAQQRAFEAALADGDNRAEVTGVSTEVWTDYRAVSYRG